MGNAINAKGGAAIGIGNRGGNVAVTYDNSIHNQYTSLNGRQISILIGTAAVATIGIGGVILYNRKAQARQIALATEQQRTSFIVIHYSCVVFAIISSFL
jgi:hypothetical protein